MRRAAERVSEARSECALTHSPIGVQGNRSAEDELLLSLVHQANPSGCPFFIIGASPDRARPRRVSAAHTFPAQPCPAARSVR